MAFPCGYCDKNFESGDEMKCHRKTEHGKLYNEIGRCGLCPVMKPLNTFEFIEHFLEAHKAVHNCLCQHLAMKTSSSEKIMNFSFGVYNKAFRKREDNHLFDLAELKISLDRKIARKEFDKNSRTNEDQNSSLQCNSLTPSSGLPSIVGTPQEQSVTTKSLASTSNRASHAVLNYSNTPLFVLPPPVMVVNQPAHPNVVQLRSRHKYEDYQLNILEEAIEKVKRNGPWAGSLAGVVTDKVKDMEELSNHNENSIREKVDTLLSHKEKFKGYREHYNYVYKRFFKR